jgi:predicted nucleic acid-binding protein
VKSAVIDASVAVKWVVEESHSDKASLLLAYDTLHAPDHWQTEAVNVLWAKLVRRDLRMVDAEARMAVLLRAPIVGSPIAGLMARAFAISAARRITIYDSLYVALAEKLNVPLVTADRKLIRSLAFDQTFARRAIWVGDLAT